MKSSHTPFEVGKYLLLAKAEVDYLVSIMKWLSFNLKDKGSFLTQGATQLEENINAAVKKYNQMENSSIVINEEKKLIQLYETATKTREAMGSYFSLIFEHLTSEFTKILESIEPTAAEAMEYKEIIKQLEKEQRLDSYEGDFIKDHKNFLALENSLKPFKKTKLLISAWLEDLKKIKQQFESKQAHITTKLKSFKGEADLSSLSEELDFYTEHLKAQKEVLMNICDKIGRIKSNINDIHSEKVKVEEILFPRFKKPSSPRPESSTQRIGNLTEEERLKLRIKYSSS